ncbi:hypothetical protein ALC62_14080 [Cyphomyrmex costatus]|uniref:Uncharacterized protein n=1 Tax=Cyphomyrmex costatus TaxID=456900 RepID=A0A195C3J3_9HYME|nr:hypothetical protein ALC62_14080 [Cyphomyrmex costatus]
MVIRLFNGFQWTALQGIGGVRWRVNNYANLQAARWVTSTTAPHVKSNAELERDHVIQCLRQISAIIAFWLNIDARPAIFNLQSEPRPQHSP